MEKMKWEGEFTLRSDPISGKPRLRLMEMEREKICKKKKEKINKEKIEKEMILAE